ncbi:hypothetical protein EDEG_03954 [Edhazardia aedis USNM 41457]|uniref:Serine/threonine-protein phosphatase 2A activator n=1 Tax=Edhazardia aedis (strain USNM 41457) TaxID=1003232 RepID=J9D0K4_EDHAE|nr:hypothetical protein EDEG_03954 [Edhazardia aedis USNM 41457]|eukprot:EJW01421.1 hypothetical protein EDEG_03954 [Edhazardia aedis USNM 41457]
MKDFVNTPAYKKIREFIIQINKSILTEIQCCNDTVNSFLQDVYSLLKETEVNKFLEKQETNAKFNYFHIVLEKKLKSLLESRFAIENIPILYKYLFSSFGNPVRLDYGTGHELNFACFLFSLVELKIMKFNECYTTFLKYFEFIRMMIIELQVLPAGSHGVWGIDDYQYLPFLFGSSEMCKITLDGKISDSTDNGFYTAVQHSKTYKTRHSNVSFEKHSPILYSLQFIENWSDIHNKIWELYEKHVLLCLSVTQHFIYSVLLPEEEKTGAK